MSEALGGAVIPESRGVGRPTPFDTPVGPAGADIAVVRGASSRGAKPEDHPPDDGGS
jgi:hypothetical protein